MNPYQQLVAEQVRLIESGKAAPLGGFEPCPRPAVAADAPHVLIFSPHPDDEVIVGGLALRLMRESGWKVVNVPVTLGSNPARRNGRLAELKACCGFIGFDLLEVSPDGLSDVKVQAREQALDQWSAMVLKLADLIAKQAPRVILFPHAADWNSTHVGTHWLLMDALKLLPADFSCHVAETEFWGAMATPNLMLELGSADVGDLVAALSFHVGEVRRNPYHLRLPAWMMDNVRRGAELAGGQGGAAPDFNFATLYRVSRWADGGLVPAWPGGRVLSQETPAGELFK